MSKAAVGVVLVCVAAGCSSGGTRQAIVGDAAADSAASGGSGGAGASGGGGGSSGSGGSGGVPLNCEGTFGAPRLLLDLGATSIASPALPGDELELFYVTYDLDGTNHRINRTTRASRTDVFPLGTEVAELNALCSDPAERAAIDVTEDGLRAYVSCADTTFLGRTLLAERTSKTAPFVASGSVATELGASVAVNAAERVAYSTGGGADPNTPLVATRATTSDAFGVAAPVPGLTGIRLIAPDPSPDELWLFGGLEGRDLAVARRNSGSDPFAAPALISVVPLDASGAPHITRDCRRLYFIGIAPADAGGSWGIYFMQR